MKATKSITICLLCSVIVEVLLNIARLQSLPTVHELEKWYVPTVLQSIIFVILLNELYKHATGFWYSVLAAFAFPIGVELIKTILNIIFEPFCPPPVDQHMGPGIMGLLDAFVGDSCPFSYRFDPLFYLSYPFHLLSQFLETYQWQALLHFFLSAPVLYILLYSAFSRFQLFRENDKNRYVSLVPVANTITILQIAKLPLTWLLVLYIPLVRLYWKFHLNKKLCQVQQINENYAWGMTLLPSVFYGKLVFRR